MTTPYTTGSITLTNGSAVVTGVGTAWQTALIAGGTIYVEADGNPLPILTVDTHTKITAAIKWKGASGTYPYAIMRDTAYGQQTVANAQALSTYLQRLDNASLAALASLVPAADRLPFFSGNAEAALTTLTAFARTLLDDPNAAAVYATLGEIPNAQLPARLRSTIAITLTDANDADGDGFYSVNAASANIPEGAIGLVLHMQSSVNTATQFYHRASNGNFWTRTKSSGAWTAWQQSASLDASQIWRAPPQLRGGVGYADGQVAMIFAIEREWWVRQRGVSTQAMLSIENTSGKSVEFSSDAAYSGPNVKIFPSNDGAAFPQIQVGRTTGSALAPSYSFIGDTNTGMYSIGSDGLGFATAGVSAVTIHQDGTFRSLPTYNNTTASAANMFVATNGTFVRSTSSGQYKTQVEDLWPNYADTILEMRPVWYRSLCPIDNPDWSYIGLIAEEVGAIEPRLVHWRTEEIVTETVEKQVAVSVERPVEREAQVARTEYVDSGLLDDEGKPLFTAVERTETIVETDMVTVEEVQTVTETEQRSVPLPEPVAEGIMYDRLVVHLIAHAQRQHAKIEMLSMQMKELLARVVALEAAGQPE
jgi:hypothetical protein